ncbi:Protein CBG15096 [Caenorhabditis briggsae]|uniref:Protein CBG15096 n=2 Tax=Caenorhabditis briggsae TaxID=6238 RepID=A8XLD7_CAEBR|nr:Protein CBG15096 [Caenorhabditis briggsae]ULU09930.1 hypothetical protein L3Y34_014353 [Caenorhabditis briggsae]CAP33462.1 Protein CBG15096 [Caenorhabditis briggsae]
MTAKRVPSKIVIAGNSKMSLNDRFSSIPKPRPRGALLKAQHKGPVKVRNPYSSNQQVVYVDSQQNAFQPHPVVRRPRPSFQHQRAVPFQSRVSFVSTVPVQRFHHQRNNFVQKGQQFSGGFKKPYRQNFNQQNQHRPKFFQARFNQNPRFQNQQQRATFPKKKSLAELDRELDDYMRKPKHTPITI